MDDQRRHGSTTHHYPQGPFTAAPRMRKPGFELARRPRPRYEGSRYRPADKLDGKAALITGGASGIGRAVAALCAREGADVAIVFLPSEQVEAQETRQAVEGAGRRCLLLPGDAGDPHFCADAVERTLRGLGGLDILVNNAAFQESREDIEKITDEQWEQAFHADIYGYFCMARAALKRMKGGAAIVNCGSGAAIAAFTESLARNLVERDIRVNCVAPTARPAEPEEIAPAFVFFASKADSSRVTGQTLRLTGGGFAGT